MFDPRGWLWTISGQFVIPGVADTVDITAIAVWTNDDKSNLALEDALPGMKPGEG